MAKKKRFTTLAAEQQGGHKATASFNLTREGISCAKSTNITIHPGSDMAKVFAKIAWAVDCGRKRIIVYFQIAAKEAKKIVEQLTAKIKELIGREPTVISQLA